MPSYKNMKSWNEEMKITFSALVDLTQILMTGDYKWSALSKYWAYKKVSESYKIDKLIVSKYDFTP